jgi:signal transduction histidine kinase
MNALGVREAITVLVVDDNVDHRTLIDHWLRSQGMVVRQAGSADGALHAMDGVDVVLLDYRLPGRNGLEVLEEIRRRPEPPAVVMITGMGSETVAVEALRAGAVDYLVKDPNYLSVLPGIVERAWRSHDLERRAEELQRLALSVTSAEHHRVFDDVVRGGRSLLRADGARMYAFHDGVLLPLAAVGAEHRDDDELSVEVLRHLGGSRVIHLDATEPTRLLVLPLLGEAEDPTPNGALAILSEDPRTFLAEELQLADTFAAFASIALGHHARVELQEKLVAHLEQSVDARRRFLASLSHELKTPLTCIAGFTETLIEHGAVLSEEERRDFLMRVRAHAAELGQLVDQLLDAAAAEGAPLETRLEPVDVDRQVATVLAALAPVIGDRQVAVAVPPLRAVADARLLRQSLANLISNAVKYSEAGTPIEISAAHVRDEVRIDVTDHGVGMSEEEVQRAFEPFWRSPRALTSATRGTGVGLALVHEHMRAMGGSVNARSAPGAGSIFTLLLPAAAPR